MTVLQPIAIPGTYEFQVADLLHDPVAAKWSTAQLDQYVNEARRQLVRDTGCLRTLQQSFCTPGVEQYVFGQVTGAVITAGGANYANPSVAFTGGGGGSGVAATLTQVAGAVNTIVFTSFGSGYTAPPTAVVSDAGPGAGAQILVGILNFNTYDVLDVHLTWGTERYSLRWEPFRRFSPWYRPWLSTAQQRQPVCWAVYGDNSIFLGPTPDQSYPMEFDTVILPTALADAVTNDNIPSYAQDPIKYYAAYLAKKNAQSYGEAESFLGDYRRTLLEAVSIYTGRIVDPYAT